MYAPGRMHFVLNFVSAPYWISVGRTKIKRIHLSYRSQEVLSSFLPVAVIYLCTAPSNEGLTILQRFKESCGSHRACGNGMMEKQSTLSDFELRESYVLILHNYIFESSSLSPANPSKSNRKINITLP